MSAATSIGIIGFGKVSQKFVNVRRSNLAKFDIRQMRLDDFEKVLIVAQRALFKFATSTTFAFCEEGLKKCREFIRRQWRALTSVDGSEILHGHRFHSIRRRTVLAG